MNQLTLARRVVEYEAAQRRMRSFLGFDPKEAVAAGIRRGWVQLPPPKEPAAPEAATEAGSAPAAPVPQESVRKAGQAPTDARGQAWAHAQASVRAAVAELAEAGAFNTHEVRYSAAVVAARVSREDVKRILGDLVARGDLRLLQRAVGARPAIYEATEAFRSRTGHN